MRKLTPQQEKFCLAYVECGNASEAYRRAYPRAKNWKPETVYKRASELLANGKVLGRVNELKADLARRNLWTREQSVQALIEVIRNPDKQTDVIAAVKELNAMHGFNAPGKLEITGTGGGPVVLNIKHRKAENS